MEIIKKISITFLKVMQKLSPVVLRVYPTSFINRRVYVKLCTSITVITQKSQLFIYIKFIKKPHSILFLCNVRSTMVFWKTIF